MSVIKMSEEELNKLLKTDVGNLLLNLVSGCLPEYLTKNEVNLLAKRFGENWFEKLGYKEPDYKKPKF